MVRSMNRVGSWVMCVACVPHSNSYWTVSAHTHQKDLAFASRVIPLGKAFVVCLNGRLTDPVTAVHAALKVRARS